MNAPFSLRPPKDTIVFLDRDGVINHDKHYLNCVEDWHLISGSAEAIAKLNAHGFRVVVVTNQSGISANAYDENDLAKVHDHMEAVLAEKGAHLDAIYFCPHSRTHGCNCRKPKPGMLLQASKELGTPSKGGFLVGDHIRDIQAGMSAGAKSFMVSTGLGPLHHEACKALVNDPLFGGIVHDLSEAVDAILAHYPTNQED